MKPLLYFLTAMMMIFIAMLAQMFVPSPVNNIITMPLTFAAAFCIYETVKGAVGK